MLSLSQYQLQYIFLLLALPMLAPMVLACKLHLSCCRIQPSEWLPVEVFDCSDNIHEQINAIINVRDAKRIQRIHTHNSIQLTSFIFSHDSIPMDACFLCYWSRLGHVVIE